MADILHETRDFWVSDAGKRGFEVYRNGATASVRVACIGHGPAPNLGLQRAIAECDKRQATHDATNAVAEAALIDGIPVVCPTLKDPARG
jgi:hypothetical protein